MPWAISASLNGGCFLRHASSPGRALMRLMVWMRAGPKQAAGVSDRYRPFLPKADIGDRRWQIASRGSCSRCSGTAAGSRDRSGVSASQWPARCPVPADRRRGGARPGLGAAGGAGGAADRDRIPFVPGHCLKNSGLPRVRNTSQSAASGPVRGPLYSGSLYWISTGDAAASDGASCISGINARPAITSWIIAWPNWNAITAASANLAGAGFTSAFVAFPGATRRRIPVERDGGIQALACRSSQPGIC